MVSAVRQRGLLKSSLAQMILMVTADGCERVERVDESGIGDDRI
jgi:hypothetical protein